MKKYPNKSNILVFSALLSAVFFVIFGLFICPTKNTDTGTILKNITKVTYQNAGNNQNTPPKQEINYNSYWIPNELRIPQEDLNLPSYASPFACFNLQTAINYNYANKIADYYTYFKSQYDAETQSYGMASDLVEFYYVYTKTLFEKTSITGSYTLDVYFYKNTLNTTYKVVKSGADTFGIVVTDSDGNSYYNGYFDGNPVFSGAEKIATDFLPVLTENDDFILNQLGVENKALYYQNAVLGHILDMGSVSELDENNNQQNILNKVFELNSSEGADAYISIIQKQNVAGKLKNSSIFFNLVADYSRGKLNPNTGVLEDGTFNIKALGFSVLAFDMSKTNQMLSSLTLVGFTKSN